MGNEIIKKRILMLRAAAFVVGLIAVFVGVLYLAYSGDSVPAPTPSPVAPDFGQGHGRPTVAPSSSPSADRLPGFLGGVDVVQLEIGDEIEFPDGVALIVELGCTQCDGPTSGFARVYRDAFGQPRVEEIFRPEELGLGPRLVETDNGVQEEEPRITGFGFAPDASEMLVAVCTRGSCGDLGYPSNDVRTTIFRSTDGGVTWSNYGEIEDDAFIAGRVGSGAVLVQSYDSLPGEAEPVARFYGFPDFMPVQPPTPDSAWPGVLSSGEIVWHTQDGGLLRDDGSVYLDPGIPGGNPTIYFGEPALSQIGDRGLASLSVAYSGGPGFYYVADVAPERVVTRAYAVGGGVEPAVWMDERFVFANASFDPNELPLPALIDLDEFAIRPITGPFLQPPLLFGRNTIHTVQRGPFARVVNTGSCLNIRAQSSATASVVDCAADGVLLTLERATTGYDGTVWEAVRTPGGAGGWASIEYLER
jgi:hypothetical protein